MQSYMKGGGACENCPDPQWIPIDHSSLVGFRVPQINSKCPGWFLMMTSWGINFDFDHVDWIGFPSFYGISWEGSKDTCLLIHPLAGAVRAVEVNVTFPCGLSFLMTCWLDCKGVCPGRYDLIVEAATSLLLHPFIHRGQGHLASGEGGLMPLSFCEYWHFWERRFAKGTASAHALHTVTCVPFVHSNPTSTNQLLHPDSRPHPHASVLPRSVFFIYTDSHNHDIYVTSFV